MIQMNIAWLNHQHLPLFQRKFLPVQRTAIPMERDDHFIAAMPVNPIIQRSVRIDDVRIQENNRVRNVWLKLEIFKIRACGTFRVFGKILVRRIGIALLRRVSYGVLWHWPFLEGRSFIPKRQFQRRLGTFPFPPILRQALPPSRSYGRTRRVVERTTPWRTWRKPPRKSLKSTFKRTLQLSLKFPVYSDMKFPVACASGTKQVHLPTKRYRFFKEKRSFLSNKGI